MTTSPPQMNGRTRPALPVIRDWQTLYNTTPEPARTPVEAAPDAPAVDLVAQAEADAIRTRAYAEAEEQRIRAEAEAEAIRLKAAAEAEKQRLANERAQMAAEEKRAAHKSRLARISAERQETERQAAAADTANKQQQQAAAAAAEEVAAAAGRWRRYAIAFYTVCAVVALPVQVAAFWAPKAPWLVIAPLMLEGAALVVTKGAAAAVAALRPHWHYRTVAWVFAFIAAGINLWHGMKAFDPATAIGTAFASLAGPGVWDLHEHGRIRKRDGALSRRERRAAKKTAEKQAAEKAAAKLFDAERQAHLENAERAASDKLNGDRASMFPRVHEHALKLAADLGETAITQAIWKQAKLDVDGAGPGESDEILRMRNNAAAKVEAARLNKPVSTLSKTTNAQRGVQTPRSSYRPVPPVRKPKDTPPYHRAAGRAHGDLLRRSNSAKNASTEEQK